MTKELNEYVRRLGQAVSILDDAIDTDNRYWEALAVGQDSAEAESSGYLVGFQAGLSACHTLFAYSDATTLQSYLDAVQSIAAEQAEEIAECVT